MMESHCSGEKQYTLKLSVGNIDINTEVLSPVFTENLVQWLVLEFLCSGEREPTSSGVLVFPDRSFWSVTQSGAVFIPVSIPLSISFLLLLAH